MTVDKMLRCYVVVSLLVSVIALPDNELNYLNEPFITDDLNVVDHRVITKDLHILGVKRLQIVNANTTRKQYPVLLQHGLYDSSDRFIEHGRNLSLAYSLIDAGFDVWLGNDRGNRYSKEHIYLDPDDPVDKMKFFDYTYEKIGLYDILATVDYILDQTNTIKLHYIGYSQGATAFLALNSLQPEHCKKFVSANLLAPVTYRKHFSHTVLSALSKVADTIYKLLMYLGVVELFPDQAGNDLTREQSRVIKGNEHETCLGDSSFKNLCDILNAAGLLGKYPGYNGGSIKQLVHFAQNTHSRQFRRWDYGLETNLQTYNQKEPPKYNVSHVTVNTVIHYGLNDHLVSSWDVLEMAHDMPNVETRAVGRETFDHSAFLDAPDAPALVYDFIIEALSYFENEETNKNPSHGETESPHTSDSGSIGSFLNEALFIVLLVIKIF